MENENKKKETLFSQIDKLIMQAMKAHDEPRTRTLRYIKTAITEARIAKMVPELSYNEEIQVLKKMSNQRADAIEQYTQYNRNEQAKIESEEKEIIEEFIPAPPTEEDIKNALGLLSIPHTKPFMGQLINAIKGIFPTADGAIVSKIVKEDINNQEK